MTHKPQSQSSHSQASGADDVLIITVHRTKILWLGASALVACFVLFAAGYYWGKESAWREIITQLQGESFGDKVTFLLNSFDEERESEADDTSLETDTVR